MLDEGSHLCSCTLTQELGVENVLGEDTRCYRAARAGDMCMVFAMRSEDGSGDPVRVELSAVKVRRKPSKTLKPGNRRQGAPPQRVLGL